MVLFMLDARQWDTVAGGMCSDPDFPSSNPTLSWTSCAVLVNVLNLSEPV